MTTERNTDRYLSITTSQPYKSNSDPTPNHITNQHGSIHVQLTTDAGPAYFQTHSWVAMLFVAPVN